MDLYSIIQKPDSNITLAIGAKDLKAVIQDLFTAFRVKERANEQTELVTRDEATKLLKVDKSTLWRWSTSGYLKPIKIGRKVYYKKNEVESMRMKGLPR